MWFARALLRSSILAGAVAAQTLATALPAGAVGVWSAQDYQASPRPYVRNLVAPNAPAPKNLLNCPRRQFGNTQVWQTGSCTVTVGQTDFEGGTEAARVLGGAADWTFQYTAAVAFPAGQYTMAGRYKSNTGSPVNFRLGVNGAGGAFATRTATTEWQRITYTFNLTGGSAAPIFARSVDGATAGDILIDQLELFAGPADLGPEAPTSHLLLGRSAFDANISYAGGSFAPAQTGVIQFPAARTFTAYTVIGVVNRTGNARTHCNLMARLGTGTGTFSAGLAENNAVAPATASAFAGYASQPIYKPYGDGWRMVVHEGDNTNQEFWIDHAMFLRSGGAMNSFSLRDISVGITSTYAFTSDYRVAVWALYPRRLSEAEKLAAYAVLQAHVAEASITMPSGPLYIGAADGDSISAGSGATNFLVQSSPLVDKLRYFASYAVSGSVLADVNGRKSRPDNTLRTAAAGGHHVLYSLYIFVNGLASYAGADYQAKADAAFAALVAYHAGRKALGPNIRTIACTVGPIEDSTDHNAIRALLNPMIIAAVGVHWDGVADFGGHAVMGPDDARDLHPLNWQDPTHPTTAGQGILAQLWKAAVNLIFPA